MDVTSLKQLLKDGNSEFWSELASASSKANDFGELFLLSSLRKKAHALGIEQPRTTDNRLRLAMAGGYSLYPLHDLIEHLLEVQGVRCDLWLGAYDNYISEIMDGESELHTFRPHAVLILPSSNRCRYPGSLTDPTEAHRSEAGRVVDSLIDLAARVHQSTQAEVVLCNFMLPARHDLEAFRSRSLGSDWSFRKCVNLELGLRVPSYLHICDLEFIANRHGGLRSHDERAWFETKQPGSPGMLVEIAREAAHLISGLRRPPKKVLVLDLDNTLWGGVIADDGMEGIELGDTSARGEAFKAFQRYIRSLKDRGTLLAVCSKNDHEKAAEPFESHPEMVLRMQDIVSFKANWEPKSENIRRIASELNLGLDSLVFVDDNPAEIEIVRQFVPEVSTILLSADPSDYVSQLQDCRHFEPKSITSEDADRTRQYRTEAERSALLASVTDMDSYLVSLQMEAIMSPFTPIDLPRVSQLINKSNQFNLTTRRRSEAELQALNGDASFIGFSTRLSDRFGDHGLIGVVIGKVQEEELEIDTWLMSCRVLKRQVEDEVLNELVRIARARGCSSIRGIYIPTTKNSMVKDFYPRMGFTPSFTCDDRSEFILAVPEFTSIPTHIRTIHPRLDP